MLDQKKILANSFPDPVSSARKLIYGGIVASACCITIGVLLPVYFYLLCFLSLLPFGSIIWAYKKVLDQKQDERQWSVNRFYEIDSYPVHPKDAEEERAERSKPLSERKGYWWKQPGPGFESVPTEEKVLAFDGTISTRHFWRRVLCEEDRGWLMPLAKHLKKHHGEVNAIVEEWWQKNIADVITEQLVPGRSYRALTKEERSLVNKRGEVEFLQGVCVALQPSTWSRKFDKRPSHIHISRLREILARKILITGDYPNKAKLDEVERIWRWRHRKMHIYLGDGFNVYGRHASKYYYRKFLDGDDWKVPPDPKLGGDPRFFATGWREAGPVWVHYDDDLPQHSIFFGGSGMGKTRGVESTMIAAVRNGSAVVWLDPKVDERMISLLAYHAKLVGREDDLMFLSVGRPELPYNNTFNPYAGYNDPSEIGSRTGAFLPKDAGENQYFIDEAKKVARISGTVCHWVNHYLGALSGGNNRANRAPKLLCWLAYVEKAQLWQPINDVGQIQSMPEYGSIKEAFGAFSELYKRICADDIEFQPENEIEQAVFDVFGCPEYSASHWIPNPGHILRYAIESRQRLVSWAIRLVHYHALIGNAEWGDIRSPKNDSRATVLGIDLDDGQRGLLDLLKAAGPHPVSAVATRSSLDCVRQWRMFYEVAIPRDSVQALYHILDRFERILDEHISQVRREDEEYQKATTSLSAPISLLISGEKNSLLCEADPDITWQRIHQERKILLAPTGVMKDRDASNAVCKALTSSLLAYGGHIQDTGGDDIDLVFGGDEMPTWATQDWSDITDKLRGAGVRTLGLTQSRAGSRFAIGSDDLMKHIDTNMKCRYTCASPSKEDAESYVELMPKINVYKPNRNVTENPALGDSGHQEVAEWSSGETWSWQPDELPLVDQDFVSRIPKLQMLRFKQGEVSLFQVPIVKAAPYSYLAEIGMHDRSRPAEVAGIDFPVDGLTGPTVGDLNWGQEDRFPGQSRSEPTDYADVPLRADQVPTRYGCVDISSDLQHQQEWLASQPQAAVAVQEARPTPTPEPEVLSSAGGAEEWVDDDDCEEGDDASVWVDDRQYEVGINHDLSRPLGPDERRLEIDGLIYIGCYEEGIGRDGEWNVYQPDGVLVRTIEYAEDEIDGNVVYYWPNGGVRRKEIWENGKCEFGNDYDESGMPMEGD